MQKTKISVCIITCNQVKYIGECLESIIHQKGDFDLEIIIGDDMSSDGTTEIVKEYAEKYPNLIKPLLHAPKIGGTENYFAVHRAATGEFIVHCDGDDLLLEGKIQRQLNIMLSDKEIVQIWHRQHYINEKSERIGPFPRRYIAYIFSKKLKMEDLALSYGLIGQHSSLMYRKSAKSIYQRDRPTLDYFFALDLASKGTSIYLNEFWGCYRVVNNGSTTTNSSSIPMVDTALSDMLVYYAEKYPKLRNRLFANIFIKHLMLLYKKRTGNEEFLKNYTILRQYASWKSLWYMPKSLFISLLHKF